MRPKENRRKGRNKSALLILFSIVTGCGIENWPAVLPPETEIKSGQLSVDFIYTVGKNNPAYFTGYDIYYRFYDPAVDDSTLSNSTDMEENANKYLKESYILGQPDRINQEGYYRLAARHKDTAVSIESPVISYPYLGLNNLITNVYYRTLRFVISIEPFDGIMNILVQDNYVTIFSFDDANIEFRRESGGGFLRPELSASDRDVPDSLFEDGHDFVAVAFFVVAYGKDDNFSTIISLYSTYLGYIKY